MDKKRSVRKKQGEVQLFLIEAMLQDPSSKWRNSDFLTRVKNRFGIGRRQTISDHLNGLIAWGLVERNGTKHSPIKTYALPKNYRSYDYLKRLYANLGSKTEVLMPSILKTYTKEDIEKVQEEHYKPLISNLVDSWVNREFIKPRQITIHDKFHITTKRTIQNSVERQFLLFCKYECSEAERLVNDYRSTESEDLKEIYKEDMKRQRSLLQELCDYDKRYKMSKRTIRTTRPKLNNAIQKLTKILSD